MTGALTRPIARMLPIELTCHLLSMCQIADISSGKFTALIPPGEWQSRASAAASATANRARRGLALFRRSMLSSAHAGCHWLRQCAGGAESRTTQ